MATLPAEVIKTRKDLLKDQAPSARLRSAYLDRPSLYRSIGRPYSARKLSFTQMYEMQTDAILAFAALVSLISMYSAKWRIECADARKAQFLDRSLRRIYGRLITQYSLSWFFGAQALVKQFVLTDPGWRFINKDAEGGPRVEEVWTGGKGAPALVWEPFVPLAPETVEPVYRSSDGRFDGIRIDATGGFMFPTIPILSSDGEEISRQVDIDHCSPPDEPVLTANRGFVPIGDLVEGQDRLVAWDRMTKRMNRVRGYDFEKSVRPYSGNLVTVSAGGFSTRVTPTHKLTVRWTAEAEEKRVVYLMRKGDWWRIGVASVVSRKAGHRVSGIAHRVASEDADAAWVLGVFDTKNEALYHERLWSCRYGIPDMVFRDVQAGRSEACLRTAQLEEIWDQIDSGSGSRMLLEEFGLDERLPFYTSIRYGNRGKTPRGPRGWTCAAVNLVSGMMEVPVDVGGAEASWVVLTTQSDHYEGDVVSLEVPPHHHYVSGSGVVVQNSLWITNQRDARFGRVWGWPRTGFSFKFWWAYEMTLGVLNRSTERKGDPVVVVRYPKGDSVDAAGVERDNQIIALEIGDKARSGAVLAIPSEVFDDMEASGKAVPKWSVEYLKAEEKFSELREILSYLDVAKFRSMMVSELSVAEGSGGTSSRNVAAETGVRTAETQNAQQEEWDDYINRYMLPQLADENFPELRDVPARKITKSFGDDEAEMAKRIFESFANANSDKLPIDWGALAEEFGMPVLSLESLAESQRRFEQQATQQLPPPVDAPAGGNAGVEPDTGFYYDARELIQLEDDSLLRSLPQTRHFEDRSILATTRLIRKTWRDLLKEQYESFVVHLDGQADLSEVDQIGLADDDDARAQRIADRIVKAWRFGASKTTAAVKRTAKALSDVFDRAGRLELRKSSLSEDDWRPEEAELAEWVKDNVASMVRSVEETTRESLRTFLVEQIKADKTQKEIAAAARERFVDDPNWRADRLVRTEIRKVYNAATAFAADQVQAQVQMIDNSPGDDPDCKKRHGRIVSPKEFLAYDAQEHANGRLAGRILKGRVKLSVEHVPAEQLGGNATVTDRESGVIYMAEGLTEEAESQYLVQVGDWLQRVPD